MSLYPPPAKTKKWPVKVISHFIGFAVCNSWLEYIRDANAEGLPKKKEVKDVMEFQSGIARSLIASNKTAPQWGEDQARPLRSLSKNHMSACPSQKIRQGLMEWTTGQFITLLTSLKGAGTQAATNAEFASASVPQKIASSNFTQKSRSVESIKLTGIENALLNTIEMSSTSI